MLFITALCFLSALLASAAPAAAPAPFLQPRSGELFRSINKMYAPNRSYGSKPITGPMTEPLRPFSWPVVGEIEKKYPNCKVYCEVAPEKGLELVGRPLDPGIEKDAPGIANGMVRDQQAATGRKLQHGDMAVIIQAVRVDLEKESAAAHLVFLLVRSGVNCTYEWFDPAST
ncbi:hypothetical protein EDC01DRAFT_744357 [Geopyxis carbonaria]|nr:hypothetical protein EDC01DRAFT_744357 [Geopyxis carbonaria]